VRRGLEGRVDGFEAGRKRIGQDDVVDRVIGCDAIFDLVYVRGVYDQWFV
jgi:hypothetical protein